MSDETKSKIEDHKRIHEEAKMRFEAKHQALVSEHKTRMDTLRENFESLHQGHRAFTTEVKETEDTSST